MSRLRLLTLVVLAWGSSLGAAPNIVLYLADDLGYGDLGCYGQKEVATPNLDALAKGGMRFERCYAGSTVCAPSRCVLLTGRHLGNAAVTGNRSGPMPDDLPTLPRQLRELGYDTMAIGKWGVGARLPDTDPQDKGFRDFFGYVSMYHAHNSYPEFLIRDGKPERLRNELDPRSNLLVAEGRLGMGVARKRVDFAPDLFLGDAKGYLEWRSREEEPFFLYLATNLPHANNEGTASGQGLEIPDLGAFAERDWPAPKKTYAAMVAKVDAQVGELVAGLRRHGMLEDTLFLFASDNGPHEEGGYEFEMLDSNGPLRGGKRDLYEGGLRVPMIASWPGRIAAGSVSEAPVAFQDLMPTLLEIGGATPDALPPTDGISLKAQLFGEAEPSAERPDLYWFLEEKGGREALLSGSWKVVGHYEGKAERQRVELFRLSDDPGEERDLSEEHPTVAEDLCAAMDRMRQGVGR